MKIKRFNQLNENISDIFNYNPTYLDKVISHITEIIRETNKISEKDFKRYDDIIKSTKLSINSNQDITDMISEHEILKYRYQYSAEKIYYKFFK